MTWSSDATTFDVRITFGRHCAGNTAAGRVLGFFCNTLNASSLANWRAATIRNRTGLVAGVAGAAMVAKALVLGRGPLPCFLTKAVTRSGLVLVAVVASNWLSPVLSKTTRV